MTFKLRGVNCFWELSETRETIHFRSSLLISTSTLSSLHPSYNLYPWRTPTTDSVIIGPHPKQRIWSQGWGIEANQEFAEILDFSSPTRASPDHRTLAASLDITQLSSRKWTIAVRSCVPCTKETEGAARCRCGMVQREWKVSKDPCSMTWQKQRLCCHLIRCIPIDHPTKC